jgi:hypothetical protein
MPDGPVPPLTLQEPAVAQDWSYLHERLKDRIKYHRDKAESGITRCKKLASLFPFLSAAVTIAAGIQAGNQSLSSTPSLTATVIGVLLTIISTWYATQEPHRHFREKVDLCIELYDLQQEMDFGLERLRVRPETS